LSVFKNAKGKALNTSTSDKLEVEDSEVFKEKNMSYIYIYIYMAFITFVKSFANPTEVNPLLLVETCDD
jgi:hypothetical protein